MSQTIYGPPPPDRFAIRLDKRQLHLLPYYVRIKAGDWNPQEKTLGRFATAEAAYECADRALVSRWLRTGRTSRLNEPVHKEKYTREEATKLYNETVRRVPKYWFMEQDEFEPLLNELWLLRKIFLLRKN
jgi:hypothetical protein